MALTSDPGYVNRKHFIEEGQKYEVEGPKQYGIFDDYTEKDKQKEN
jgi:hypothetical protein